MKNTKLDISLINALIELDQWLELVNKNLYLELIGASALILHNIEIERPTIDLDISKEIKDNQILNKINEIGMFYGLASSWIERPRNIKLPKNFKLSTHKLFKDFKRIDVKIVDIDTLLVLKIAAYYDRRVFQITDYEDIQKVIKTGYKITNALLLKSIKEIKKSPNYKKEDLNDFIKEI